MNLTASDITVTNAGKVDSAITNITVDNTLFELDSSNFLVSTLYGVGSLNSQLINGDHIFALENNGTVTLPAGGTITEGTVTSNPTIQLTPASPDVVSQKLVIKGGGNYNAEDNGIALNWYIINPQVSDTVEISVNSVANANQTLYWWIHPEGAGISDPGSGTVELGGGGAGNFSFVVDSDDYEFTVRVSPINNQYDPATTGVETLVFNEAAPSFADYHLHLTTGDLTETSIILGTDDHNVRTTTNGDVEINTFLYPSGGGSGKWTFGSDGSLALPTNGNIASGPSTPQVGSSVVIADDGNGGVEGWGPQALAVPYNDNIISTYAIGSTITWQDGTTATITGFDSYAPNYIDIFWDAPKTGTLFPITLKTANYIAADFAPQWTFGTDGTTTLPGAVINDTVTKDGANPTMVGRGRAATVTANPSNNTNLNIGTFLGVSFGPSLTLDITVAENGDISAVVASSEQNQLVGSTVTVFGGGVLGGTNPVDNVVFTVETLTDIIIPTPIDITKTINKLSDGNYTLADGTEGQIMYLVRRVGTTTNGVTVTVANGHINGTSYTDIDHYPFSYGGSNGVDIDTLIFTDGAWQATGGDWD